MTDEVKWIVEMLREGACCSVCNIAYPTIDRPFPCEERVRTIDNMDKAADLIESLSAELEQVKRERGAAVEDLRKVCRATEVCFCCKSHNTDYTDYVSNDCMDCIKHCNWQWRGVKE